MVTVHPKFDPYLIYEPEARDPALEALYHDREEKEGEVIFPGWNHGDAMTDEAFEESQRYADAKAADSVENVTLQIFAALYSIADRTERIAIDEAIAFPTPYDEESIPEIPEIPEKKSTHSHHFRPFQRDSNFYSEDFDPSVHSPNLMRKIFSVITNLFLGIKLDDQKNQMTQDDMDELLKRSYMVWQYSLKEHYADYFQDKIKLGFRQAEELLARRQMDERIVYLQRVTFYAILIITAIGKLVDHKRLAMVGAIASSITLLFMIIHYGTSSFREAQEAASLKFNTDLVYYEASEYRKMDSVNTPPV